MGDGFRAQRGTLHTPAPPRRHKRSDAYAYHASPARDARLPSDSGWCWRALPAARAHLGEGATEEDLLSYIAFPAQADEFFARRAQKQRRRLPYQVTAVADGGEGGC